MPSHTFVLLLATFAATATAQQVTPAPPRDAAARALVRALDDLRRLDDQLQKQAHAYTGTTRAVVGDDDGTAAAIEYSGAFRDGLDLLRIGELAQLAHGERQVQRTGAGAWTKPQGDMPDCPLSPRTLSRRLLDATVVSSTAVSFDDRPAQRLHVVWQGPGATALFADISSPDPKASKVVERLVDLHKKWPAERLVADATVVYDPATRAFFTATVRIALLQPDQRPADAEALPSPVGLPPLQHDPILQCQFTVQLQPAAKVPWPEIDAATRQLLQPGK